MTNPWLTISLQDYEGHMDLPDVGQAEMLATEFAGLLRDLHPKSVALIGCSGGNGFAEAAEAGVERLVGLDINAAFVAEAATRFARTMPGLELHCADIAADIPDLKPVELVFAALVFEYVDVSAALRNVRRLCQPGGVLAALVQLSLQGAAPVTPSPFVSLKALGSLMRLVPPGQLRDDAQAQGFLFMSEQRIALPSGKQFSLQRFKRQTDADQHRGGGL